MGDRKQLAPYQLPKYGALALQVQVRYDLEKPNEDGPFLCRQ